MKTQSEKTVQCLVKSSRQREPRVEEALGFEQGVGGLGYCRTLAKGICSGPAGSNQLMEVLNGCER
jgi:hypothetical protein